RERDLDELVRRRARAGRHLLERDAGARARDVVPVLALVPGERENGRASLARSERREKRGGGLCHRSARRIIDLRGRGPGGGQRGRGPGGGQHGRGQGSVEKLSAVDHGDGAPNATLDGTPSLVMRSCLLLVSLVLACPSLAAADEALWALLRGGDQ